MSVLPRLCVSDSGNFSLYADQNTTKVIMTEEQLEVLRRQISAYQTICENLRKMHTKTKEKKDKMDGMRLSNIYCDPLMTSSGHNKSARQRWTPTSTQLQILEGIFGQGNGTPGKQKVKELTNELSQHGPISETNVYNWFQNRRARSKRKQSVGVPVEIESPKEKKSKVEPHEKSATRGENVSVQSPELSDNAYCFDTQLAKGDSMFDIDRSLRFSEGFDHVALLESVPRMDYLLDKIEVPEGFTHYQLGEEFDTSG